MGFIKRVLSRQCTIKEAALEFKIKFSTAKAILQTFKREGRIGKKKTRSRNSALCQIRTSSQDLDVDEVIKKKIFINRRDQENKF